MIIKSKLMNDQQCSSSLIDTHTHTTQSQRKTKGFLDIVLAKTIYGKALWVIWNFVLQHVIIQAPFFYFSLGEMTHFLFVRQQKQRIDRWHFLSLIGMRSTVTRENRLKSAVETIFYLVSSSIVAASRRMWKGPTSVFPSIWPSIQTHHAPLLSPERDLSKYFIFLSFVAILIFSFFFNNRTDDDY